MMSQLGEVRAACLVWPATRIPAFQLRMTGDWAEHPELLAAIWLIIAVPDPGLGGAVERRTETRSYS